MSNRLLLVTESEAAYIAKALDLWLTIHAGEFGRELDEARVDRFQFGRKLEGKYTEEEVEEIGAIALAMMGDP
jgi:hypothetical protein